MALISVIVPVYNAEKYLNRCIDSILGQTFKDFELILIDDGSKDQSGCICDEYEKKDKRIKVIHQDNKGQAAARNKGVLIAQSDWVAFVDADDLIHQQMLEYLYRAATDTGNLLAVCKAEEGQICPEEFNLKQEYNNSIIEISEKRLLQWCTNDHIEAADKYVYWIVWGKLIHKKLLQRFAFSEGKVYEDNAVVFKWLYSAGTVAVCDNVMYFYYVNNTGTTKSNYSIRKLDWLWALEEQIKFYTKIKFFKMVNAVGIRFIRESMREYENIQKYLQDQKQAKKLRRRIVRFFVKERKRVNISREETLDIFTRLYPRPMHFFWKIKKKVIK